MRPAHEAEVKARHIVVQQLEPIDSIIQWARPEICLARVEGLVIGITLAPMRSEWLPDIHRVWQDAAAAHGGPVPGLFVARIDRRFPVQVGFDSNLRELANGFRDMRPHLTACAAVIEFGGMLGATMRAAIAMISRVTHGAREISVHRTVVEGVHHLANERMLVDAKHTGAYLRAVRVMRAHLDVSDSS